MNVILIGTLDTKGEEYAYIRKLLQALGIKVLLIDAGSMGAPACEADIARQEVYAAAGTTLEAVQKAADRGRAIELAAKGVAVVVRKLHANGEVASVLGLGGSAGTTIATAAMRALPLGIPKLMVSTLASGNVRSFVDTRDILMMHSVVDIAGLNRISKTILENAAAAMAGMVTHGCHLSPTTTQAIAATMFGVTTPCVTECRRLLPDVEFLTFHATGTGGRTMEDLIRDGLIAGVLDLTTTELADELVGGILSAGPDRLTAASAKGVPQVIGVGALDMANFGPRDTVPDKFKDRKFYQHNSNVTLMRTTPEENDHLGQQIAQKACASSGPTAILLPLRGVSAIDVEGGPFWWPEADQALFQSLRNWIYGVELIELDCHINDPEYARTAVETLNRLMLKV